MADKLLPLNKYKELLKNWPVFTVDVVFFDEDMTKILLFKRNYEPVKGVYYATGGRLNKNEKLIDCAVRQAWREAGIKIDKKKLIFGGVQEEIHKNSKFKGISYHAVGIFFVYKLKKEKIKLDDQHSDHKWFSVNDKKIHPLIKIRIMKVLKNQKNGKEI